MSSLTWENFDSRAPTETCHICMNYLARMRRTFVECGPNIPYNLLIFVSFCFFFPNICKILQTSKRLLSLEKKKVPNWRTMYKVLIKSNINTNLNPFISGQRSSRVWWLALINRKKEISASEELFTPKECEHMWCVARFSTMCIIY